MKSSLFYLNKDSNCSSPTPSSFIPFLPLLKKDRSMGNTQVLNKPLMCSPMQNTKKINPGDTCLLGSRDFYPSGIDFSELKKIDEFDKYCERLQTDDFISFLELRTPSESIIITHKILFQPYSSMEYSQAYSHHLNFPYFFSGRKTF